MLAATGDLLHRGFQTLRDLRAEKVLGEVRPSLVTPSATAPVAALPSVVLTTKEQLTLDNDPGVVLGSPVTILR